MSPFTSLPEIRSFVAQNCSDNMKTINDKCQSSLLSSSPSWEKTGSWSWKSNHRAQLNSLKNQQIELQHQVSDINYSDLTFF